MKSLFVPVLAFTTTLAVFCPLSLIGIDAHHDGVMLKPAMDILHGQVLFKDTFCQYGSFSAYFQALLLGLFGSSLKVLKLSTAFIYALSAGALVFCWGQFLPVLLVIVSFLIWLFYAPFIDVGFTFLPWSSVYSLFFQVLTQISLVLFFSDERKKYAVAGGVACALTFLSRQSVGIPTFFAAICLFCILILLPKHRNEGRIGIACFLTGIGTVMTGFLLKLLWSGSFHDWYFQTIVWPHWWVEKSFPHGLNDIVYCLFFNFNKGIPFLLLLIEFILPGIVIHAMTDSGTRNRKIGMFVYLIFIGLLSWSKVLRSQVIFQLTDAWPSAVPITFILFSFYKFGYPIFRIQKLDRFTLGLFSAFSICFASWPQYYPVFCPRHVFWALSPFFGFFVYIVFVVARKNQLIVATVFLCLLVPTWNSKRILMSQKLSAPLVLLTKPSVLAGMWVTSNESKKWTSLSREIDLWEERHPKTPMLLESGDPIYATLMSNFENPKAIYVNWEVPGNDHPINSDRTKFIREKLPLIFTQTDQNPFIKAATKNFKYKPILELTDGVLMAPVLN